MTAFEALLEVQEQDTAIDQLRHRRHHLAERAELAVREEHLAEVETRLADATVRHDAVSERQSRLEADVQAVEVRIAEIDKRLYSGTVSAARELQAMAAEVDSLKARRSYLEDQILGAMEELEPLGDQVAVLDAERVGLQAEAGRLRAAIAEAEAAIDAEMRAAEELRQRVAESVPADLMETYERLRAKLGGVGAARLVGPSCTGCHLTLPASELARIRREPADALVLCDQCGRILVR